MGHLIAALKALRHPKQFFSPNSSSTQTILEPKQFFKPNNASTQEFFSFYTV
jgi:hypothetical protein